LKGRIFLTGGTGSLGKAILARAEREGWDCEFTIFSRDEVKQGEMKAQYRPPKHRYVLGDVRDERWLSVVMRHHDAVVHAAAYKQVPAAEVNSGEAIESNVIGSRNIVRVAVDLGIPKVLGVSTDKACAPVNCYGQTKALMERLFQQANMWGTTQFNLIRYGNVLGSRGSVVPLFRQQAKDGVITVTDDRMTRFWLTLDDAVDLVVAGLAETEPGTIIVPKAPASTMDTLALAVAPNAHVKVIGIRPGEKMHEQLIHAGESMHADDIGEHFRVYPAFTGHHGNLPEGYEYRSDTARQLSIEELRGMLE
jgi:UDP-N-acetylglucosamine 4,6-dehydratase